MMAAAAAATVVVVAAVAVVAARSRDRGTELRAADGSQSSSDPSSTTSTTATTAGSSATTTTTTSHVVGAPVVTTAPVVVVDAAPATWRAASGGLTASVDVSATRVAVADVVRFAVTMEDEAGSVLRVGVDYGDGTPTGVPAPTHVDCAPGSSGAGAAGDAPAHKQVTFEHAYRVAGATQPRLIVRSDGCNRAERSLEATGTVTVIAAAAGVTVPTNGPLPPTVAVDRDANDGTAMRIVVAATDLDGYVQRVEVDWGDGTATEVRSFALDQCADDPHFWRPSQQSATLDHTYASPGPHTVVVRAVSSGCTNADLQRGTGRLDVGAAPSG
jgi:hypothetical protein